MLLGRHEGRSSERGVSSIEWGLVVLLIGILAISAITFFGGQVADLWDKAADASDGSVSVVSSTPSGGEQGDSTSGGSTGGGGSVDYDDPDEAPECDDADFTPNGCPDE